MATEEVVLRREKLPEHGPRLRGQSTYLALLSSLATDLDIMLSDLRNSHNSQPLSTSSHHPLHQRLAANHTASGGPSHCTTGFLQSSLRDSSSANYPPQQHSIHLIPAAAAASGSSYAAHHSRYQPHNSTPSYCDIQNHKPRASPPTLTGGAGAAAPPYAEDHWRPAATAGDADADDVFGATTGHGLLEASKQIQKLPLWSYQHKQLQQPPPQKIQNKVKAKTGLPDDSSSDLKCFQCNPQARNRGGRIYSNNRRNQSINKWLAQSQRPESNIYGNSTDSQNHAINSTANTSATSAPNQFASASSGATIPAADNQRRLPFCGLDSSKGSDNNGESTASATATPMNGGKTNLCFDLTDSAGPATHGSGSIGAGGNFPLNGTDALEQFHSLDASNESVVSCDVDDGQFEDDTQALLPKSTGNRNSSNHGRSLYKDELSQSRTSLVSSSDGGILAEGETSSETSRGSDDCPPCDLGLVERLLLTHPVWFLPSIQRSGAVHFLQGKEEGNFIVRGSSQKNTMAVSVRLPPHTGPYIEHYLIQSIDGILSLESSRFKFDSIPTLIAHYAQCCDELPVQLALPRALCETNNRQQLSSLALLGQEFWRYPMSCPKSTEKNNEPVAVTQLCGGDSDVKSPNSITETSGLGTMLFSGNSNATSGQKLPGSRAASQFFGAVSPSDTTSSMSSFTTSGGQHMQLMSPESVDSIILTMSPVDANNARNLPLGSSGFSSEFTPSGVNGLSNNLSTFKSNAGAPAAASSALNKFKSNIDGGEFGGNGALGRVQRPQPPNTLNLDLRKPPAPPMRWTKPMSPNSPLLSTAAEHANFTVTTTVTFSTNSNNSQFVEVTTPAAVTPAAGLAQNNATFQTFAKRLSPEGECKDTLSSQGSLSNGSKWASQSSKDSNNSQRKILTPVAVGTPTSAFGGSGGKSRKSKARKESKHYQESDILESPQIYCQSALGDKISDYEDLWSNDPSDRTGLLSSFKPVDSKRPDLLAETPTSNSLSSSANNEAPAKDPLNATDTQQLLPYTDEAPPRSRNGLLLPSLMSQSLSEDQLKGSTKCPEGDATPTPQSPAGRSKQGSPFYAEPADALRQATASILRRSQRGPLLPANHRHSEPPKGGLPRTPLCPLLMPPEADKMAGSLDELKKKQQQQQQQQNAKRNRSRLEQWQLDSSWEFMGNSKDQQGDDEDGDYDSDDMFAKQQRFTSHADKENEGTPSGGGEGGAGKKRPITIHQIIAKRLPNLNLPELVRCSTPPHQQQHLHPNDGGAKHSNDCDPSQSCSRLSSYDNVERNLSFFLNGIDSAQSDDGTVFSEPWDSQWDATGHHDDTTINSDTIHLSKCRAAVSEDDTIIEELNTKETNEDTLKAKKTNGRLKVATILRSPSMRDREILCHPRNKINAIGATGAGDSLGDYTLQLAQDQTSTFARNIENFISCTKESREAAPQVVMRNMRQFMNGMKNYLVKHGEGKFHQEVESARSRLKSDEFLNLDAILERVMHQLVVLPLREHLYGMFVDYYTRSEDIQLLAQNVKYACGRDAVDFGIRAAVTPPSHTSLMAISNLLLRLQEAELPLDKLDLFLTVIATIFEATGCPRGQQLGADDFLPVLVYVVAKCGFVGAEIEAEFMWGLLQPTLLNGEPGYYLTALCSAVHVLKSFMSSEGENGTGSLDWRSSSLPACSSVLRVIIPDECNGSLQTRTLPVRPNTTTREVCRIIALKARITNPQDYALFKLVDGEETLLNDVECPQDIRLSTRGKHCMLAYKRIDAKIAWPTAQTHHHPATNGY